jgi:hypothetical protein
VGCQLGCQYFLTTHLATHLATLYPLLYLLATLATQFFELLRNFAQTQFQASIFALFVLFPHARYIGEFVL